MGTDAKTRTAATGAKAETATPAGNIDLNTAPAPRQDGPAINESTEQDPDSEDLHFASALYRIRNQYIGGNQCSTGRFAQTGGQLPSRRRKKESRGNPPPLSFLRLSVEIPIDPGLHHPRFFNSCQEYPASGNVHSFCLQSGHSGNRNGAGRTTRSLSRIRHTSTSHRHRWPVQHGARRPLPE